MPVCVCAPFYSPWLCVTVYVSLNTGSLLMPTGGSSPFLGDCAGGAATHFVMHIKIRERRRGSDTGGRERDLEGCERGWDHMWSIIRKLVTVIVVRVCAQCLVHIRAYVCCDVRWVTTVHIALTPSGNTGSIQHRGNIASLKPVWCRGRNPCLNVSQYSLCSAKHLLRLSLSLHRWAPSTYAVSYLYLFIRVCMHIFIIYFVTMR